MFTKDCSYVGVNPILERTRQNLAICWKPSVSGGTRNGNNPTGGGNQQETRKRILRDYTPDFITK